LSAEQNSAGQLARGASWGLLAQAVDKILPVAITLYLARVLVPADFGIFAFVFAYLALFQTLTEYSLDTVLVRMMTQRPKDRERIFRAGLSLKLLLALVSAAVATLAAPWVSAGKTPMALMLPASLILVSAMGAAYRAYFRSRLDIRSVFLLASARSLLLAIAVVCAVVSGAGLGVLFASMAAANLLAFLGVAVAARSRVRPHPSFDPELWRTLAHGLAPLLANALAMTISLRAGQVLLMSMRGPVEVGLLGAASRVVEAFTLLPEALMITIYPLMAGLHRSDPKRLLATAEKSTRYLAVATGLPVLLCAVAGQAVMGLLFGSEFARAGDVLSLLALTALLSATGTVMINLLVAAHREVMLSRNTIVFAVITVIASVFLIRAYGYTGAAVAMVATSFASQVSLSLLASTRDYARPCLLAGLRTFLAVFVAAAVANALPVGLAVEMAAAVLVYAVALVLLGVANAEEWRFVRSVLRAAAAPGQGGSAGA